MIPAHLHWIKTYGYLGAFASLMLGMFGLPIPDETIVAFIGFLVFKQYFHPIPSLLATFLGSIFGITLNYVVGRYLGVPVLHKYGKFLYITSEKMARAHQWFEKYGKWSLFGAYFFPGVRHLTPFSAGVADLEYWKFVLFAYSGGFLWVVTFLTVGYMVGNEWQKVIPMVESYLWALVAGAVVLGLAAYLVYRTRSSPRKPENQTGDDESF
jgi:membrane protein DedA with SNARE-associated domain